MNAKELIRRSPALAALGPVLMLIGLAIPASLAADQADALPLGRAKVRLVISSLEAGKLMNTASGASATVDDIAAAAADKDVIVIGELHDSYECHAFQRDLVEALAKRNPRLVIGFEFFDRGDDPALELWRTGAIGETELLRKTGWYVRSSMNYGYTRLIMDVVRARGLKAVGLNVPREIVHKVSTGGLAGLSAEEKALFPGVAAIDPEHEFFIRTIFGEQAALMPGWFGKMYEAQRCWDTVMAESMRQVLAGKEFKGYKGVIIAGSAHVAYGLGIPFRYLQANRKARLLTVVPVMASPAVDMMHSAGVPPAMGGAKAGGMMGAAGGSGPAAAAVFSRGLGDFVLAVSPTDSDYFPNFGFSGKMNDKGEFEVTSVQKGSVAERNGLSKGDVVMTIDGVKISSVEGLRLLLSAKRWDDSAVFEVRKNVKAGKS